jgi:chemotaxis protein MotB
MAKDNQTIIIKRIKKGGHAAHGGAWKVAYADFVTAMMAFFLLLWLLSSASEEQKEGISEYFAPTQGIKDEMGIGVEGGESPSVDGTKKSDLSPVGIMFGAPPVGELQKDPTHVSDEEAQNESKAFKKLAEELKKTFEEEPELQKFKDNIIIEETPEGLRIQVVDQENESMFESDSAVLLPHTKKILETIAHMVVRVPNNIAMTGHTDSAQYGGGTMGYSNWELSADRANASRRFMITTDVPEKRIVRMMGAADREHIDKVNPLAAKNRRISMLLLKKEISPYPEAARDELLAPPKPKPVTETPKEVTPKPDAEATPAEQAKEPAPAEEHPPATPDAATDPEEHGNAAPDDTTRTAQKAEVEAKGSIKGSTPPDFDKPQRFNVF